MSDKKYKYVPVKFESKEAFKKALEEGREFTICNEDGTGYYTNAMVGYDRKYDYPHRYYRRRHDYSTSDWLNGCWDWWEVDNLKEIIENSDELAEDIGIYEGSATEDLHELKDCVKDRDKDSKYTGGSIAKCLPESKLGATQNVFMHTYDRVTTKPPPTEEDTWEHHIDYKFSKGDIIRKEELDGSVGIYKVDGVKKVSEGEEKYIMDCLGLERVPLNINKTALEKIDAISSITGENRVAVIKRVLSIGLTSITNKVNSIYEEKGD